MQHTSTSDMMSSLMQDFWKHKVILNINKFWPKQRVITDRLEYKHEQRHCSPYSLFQDARCVCSHIGFEYSDQWHQFHMTVIPNDGISSRWKCEAVNPLMSDPRLLWKPSQVGKKCDLLWMIIFSLPTPETYKTKLNPKVTKKVLTGYKFNKMIILPYLLHIPKDKNKCLETGGMLWE